MQQDLPKRQKDHQRFHVLLQYLEYTHGMIL
jgi:hypothetical protein